jgi:elongation factor Ts
MVTTEQIKALRDATGISVMQCKKALEEAGGDAEKAKVLLRKRGANAAEKKAERALGAGVIAAYIHNGAVGAMVELSCETDFVAKNEEFRKLAYELAMQVAASNPQFVRTEEVTDEAKRVAKEVFAKETVVLPAQAGKPQALQDKILAGKLDAYFADKILLEQPFIKDAEQTVRALIESAIQKFGEKIDIARFARFAVGNP